MKKISTFAREQRDRNRPLMKPIFCQHTFPSMYNYLNLPKFRMWECDTNITPTMSDNKVWCGKFFNHSKNMYVVNVQMKQLLCCLLCYSGFSMRSMSLMWSPWIQDAALIPAWTHPWHQSQWHQQCVPGWVWDSLGVLVLQPNETFKTRNFKTGH